MSSTMAMWDMVAPFRSANYLQSLGTFAPHTCERCGREIPLGRNWNKATTPKRFCSELCRKRAERARWKAKWKAKGINKYIGGRPKDELQQADNNKRAVRRVREEARARGAPRLPGVRGGRGDHARGEESRRRRIVENVPAPAVMAAGPRKMPLCAFERGGAFSFIPRVRRAPGPENRAMPRDYC